MDATVAVIVYAYRPVYHISAGLWWDCIKIQHRRVGVGLGAGAIDDRPLRVEGRVLIGIASDCRGAAHPVSDGFGDDAVVIKKELFQVIRAARLGDIGVGEADRATLTIVDPGQAVPAACRMELSAVRLAAGLA